MVPFPSLTKTWHTESYPAISPTRPELSTDSKTVVITGGVSAFPYTPSSREIEPHARMEGPPSLYLCWNIFKTNC